MQGSFELTHNQLQEEQGCFRGLLIFWEVRENTTLLFATERWIGKNDVDALPVADLAQGEAQAVAMIDLGRFQTMQQEIHLRKQVGQGL